MLTRQAPAVGAAARDGTAVWHVRAMPATVSAWGLGNATVDFYIGQADILLRVLRIHGTAKLGGKLIQETIEDRYSGYGEPVTVKLPAACRATTAAIRGAVRYYAGFSVPHGGQQTIAVVKHQAEPDLPVLRLLLAPGGTGDDRRQS